MQRDTVGPNNQVIIMASVSCGPPPAPILEKPKFAPRAVLPRGLCPHPSQVATQDGGVVLGFHIQKSA